MFDVGVDGWTYGPLIFIAILYFLWRFLRPNRNRRDRRSRDFKTRYGDRKRESSLPTEENEEDLKTYRERWDKKRKF